MPFFEPMPPPPPPPEVQESTWAPPLWDRPSEADLGVAVGLTVLLARTEVYALALDDVHAHRNGFGFSLVVRRNPMVPEDPTSHGHPMWMYDRGARIGLEFSDGTKVTSESPAWGGRGGRASRMVTLSLAATPGTTVGPWGPVDADGIPVQPVLIPRGGGGGGREGFTFGYWCYPLPPAGPITVHADWPDEDIDEVSVSIDADLIREAASRTTTLWEHHG
ncbi:MAG TPA: hypothetical protein VIY72_06590 [Acidimicrobiales bacterium]